ncbi:YgfZ/GcvT domain-containing protein [Paludibacterium purpuratum]|uniref:Uncharacterized protein n=1 Tax=Paludibacterium purpuratum TaxID=1144873 RepID=A0A4R7B2B8_9NEIS|nr:folate-binding protein YgfZ [Paludibacterium purpuratum]TDR77879.1 hypothetical protein DFP86_109120 [Paludibacterium purpuratum]
MSTQSKLESLETVNPQAEWGDAQYAAQVTALNQGAVICRLSQFRLLRVTGEDAATFLQGQLSNDVRLLDGCNAQYTGYSSAKGRLLASSLCWKSEESYFLLVASDLAESIAKRLTMFIMRSKVKLSIDEAFCLFGFKGEQAEMALTAKGYDLPIQPLQSAGYANGSMCIRLPSGGVLLALGDAEAEVLRAGLPTTVTEIGDEAWSLLDIAAGIPWITAATQEQFVAQMVNMDLFGAISFTKGCYPGQEIIARTRYLGKIKRRMYRVKLSILSSAGGALYSPGMEGQSIGMIVNVARDADGQYQALAAIQSASWDEGIYLDVDNKCSVENLSLPYSHVDE